MLFLWLFGVMMWCSFGVVRHADAVAANLGEPYGTLVLTFSVITIEVALFASIMLHGQNNPTLARDAMFATLMIVLNGMVGAALLMGALRYWEQECNLDRRPRLPRRHRRAFGHRAGPAELHRRPRRARASRQARRSCSSPSRCCSMRVFIFIQTMRHQSFFDEPDD